MVHIRWLPPNPDGNTKSPFQSNFFLVLSVQTATPKAVGAGNEWTSCNMFNQRPGHILRGSMPPTSFGTTRPDSRQRHRGAFPGPPSHQPWPWRCEPDFHHGGYTVAADEAAWLDDPGPFGLPNGRVSPPLSRRTSGHAERSLSPPGAENRVWSPFSPTHRGPPSPMHEWESVLPEVFSPPGVTTPAYSVEEPVTPTRPDVFPAPSNPRHRHRRRSSRHFHSPSPDRTRLPPRTQRCETLPSSTPSPRPESPSSPRRADHHHQSSSPFHHHNHSSSPLHNHESSSFHYPPRQLHTPPRQQRTPPRQLLLAAHQRTRRHLRALERELARLQVEERRFEGGWGREGGWGEW